MVRENERPDLVGVVLTWAASTTTDFEAFRSRYGFPPAQAFEVWEGAFETWGAQKLLERWRRKTILVLCYHRSARRQILAPDRVPARIRDNLLRIASENAQREARDPAYRASYNWEQW